MAEFEPFINDSDKMIIETADKKCEIRAYLSVADIEIVSEKLKENSSIDSRFVVAEIIASHSNEVFSMEDVIGMDDTIFEKYINLCIKNDDTLKRYFETIEISDIDERFVQAVNETGKYYLKQMATALKGTLQPKLTQIQESTRIASQNLANAIAPVLEITENLRTMMSSVQFQMAENIRNITNAYMKAIPDYSNLFSGMIEAIGKLLDNIHIPTISDSDKEKLIETYASWGKLGWTVPPNAEINVFYSEPLDSKDAYKRLKTYFGNDDLENLFEEIRELRHIKKSDIDEAKECFRIKKYKACALIIFSMIDARLIRSQRDEDCGKKGRRPSGKTAADNLFGRMEAKYINEDMLFALLDQANIMAALKTVFENGNDFKNQPIIINRNFLNHGMLYRKVTRKDCIMLFLLLYNFTQHLNTFGSKKQN